MSARLLQEETRRNEEGLRTRALEAQKRWDALSPKEQWLRTLARKCYGVHSIRTSDAQTMEESARHALKAEVSEKFADWLLKKRTFRRLIGLGAYIR
jgi:hypothetical protein